MSQQIDDQPPADPGTTAGTTAAREPSTGPRPLHLPSLTVRGLMAELSEAEDALRDLEPFVVHHGRLVVNPARGPWVTRERAVVAELRSRHLPWRGEVPLVTAPDHPGA